MNLQCIQPPAIHSRFVLYHLRTHVIIICPFMHRSLITPQPQIMRFVQRPPPRQTMPWTMPKGMSQELSPDHVCPCPVPLLLNGNDNRPDCGAFIAHTDV